MKVGVLTLPLKGNYGGVLQAFALLKHLENEGHEAYLVDRQWDVRENKTLIYYFQKFVFHYIIIKRVKRFCKVWIQPRTNKINNQKSMELLGESDFDAFIVGSDQVWRVEHTSGVKNNYFLDFVSKPGVKKIAYAASFGKDSVDVTQEQTKVISKLLADFDAISVREDSGVKLCKQIFNVKAEHVLDPTLLVDNELFKSILVNIPKNTKNKLLTTYVLDNKLEKKIIVDTVSNTLGLKINNINYKKNPEFLLKNNGLDVYNYVYPSVENWLLGFRDAEFIVTDSFHGMLFSIAFKKQFLVIGNEKRGLARFKSFLNEFNLSSRLITTISPFKLELLDELIDYDIVDSKLKNLRHLSRSFLTNALEN